MKKLEARKQGQTTVDERGDSEQVHRVETDIQWGTGRQADSRRRRIGSEI